MEIINKLIVSSILLCTVYQWSYTMEVPQFKGEEKQDEKIEAKEILQYLRWALKEENFKMLTPEQQRLVLEVGHKIAKATKARVLTEKQQEAHSKSDVE